MKDYKIRKVKIKDGTVISGYEDEYIFKTIDEWVTIITKAIY